MGIYFESILRFFLITVTFVMSMITYGDTEGKVSEEVVVVATHDYNPLYNNQDEGLLAELYREAFKAVNLKVEFRAYPIGRGVQYLAIDRVDATSPGRILMDVTSWSDYNFVDVLKIQV